MSAFLGPVQLGRDGGGELERVGRLIRKERGHGRRTHGIPMFESQRTSAVRARAFDISLTGESGTPEENWLQAERELTVAWDYDTADGDLERLGMTLSRLPAEAGVVWWLSLPRGERLEGWEPGNHGLEPPAEIAALIDAAVGSKPLVAAPPASSDPGAIRLREMLQSQRDALLVHDPGSRLGQDLENLHQHRVAARRVQAFVRATRRSLDAEWRQALVGRLRDLGEATGPVRDLDVLLEHVRDELRAQAEVDRPAGNVLLAKLELERDLARRRLLEAMDGDAYRALLGQLRAPPRLAGGVEALQLDRIARKEFRRLAAAVDGLGKRPNEAALHGLRILLKRVRYAAEFAAPNDKVRKRFLADARALQDLLGEHQDAVVAEQRLQSTAVTDETTAVAFVAGRLAERQRARRARVSKRLPRAWKRLHSSGSRLV
jgi:CHAD domain-containing protein